MAENVQINLNARNNAGPAIKQVQTELNGLGRAASSAGSGLASLGGALAGGALFGAAIAGVQQLGGAIVDMAAGAAKLETLRTSFDNLAGGVGMASADMLEGLRAASRGMIADQDLLLAANKALLLGVADSVDELTGLMDIARVRGAAMGLSMTQAFDNIVTGLGRGSALILDNLGIAVDLDRVNREYAEGLGKTASALTVMEQKQALINAVMAQSADMVNGATDSMSESAVAIGSMGAAWQNLKDQLGTLVSPAVATAMQGLADALNAVNAGIQEAQATSAQRTEIFEADMLGGARTQLEQDLEKIKHAGLVGTDEWAAKVKELQSVYAELGLTFNATTGQWEQALGGATAAFGETEGAARGLAGAEADTGNAAAAAAPQVGQLSDAMKEQISEAQAATRALYGLTGQIKSFFTSNVTALGVQGAIAGNEELTRKANAYIDVLRQQGLTGDAVYLSAQQYINGLLTPYQNQIDAINKAERATANYGSTAASAYDGAQSALDTLTGKVQSVLSLDAGVDAASLLPREDAVNENARRLADIAVNGFKGQDWLGAFAESVPDIFQALSESGDPKGAAAQMLRDFQDGLVPDLLDKDRAKELVKRMITGEQTMAALAQEIAGELSQELGVALPQAQAAAFGALGVAPTEGGGTTGVGEGAAAELSSEATLKSMAKAGAEAAMTWGTAFLDSVAANVPAALIQMLTTLITPQVQANLAAAQSQQGAK